MNHEPSSALPTVRNTLKHCPSHTHLLTDVSALPVAGTGHAAVDAVMVPVSRTLFIDGALRSGIRTAWRLAKECDAVLVLLCSQQARADDVRSHDWRGVRALAIDMEGVPAGHWFDTRTMASCSHRVSTSGREPTDLGTKRNMGLVLARLHGWITVVFCDDDVTPWSADEHGPAAAGRPTMDGPGLLRARAALDDPTLGLGAVGFPLLGWNDNSVVCRARAAVGHPQGVFIGGGALVVRVDESTPFFPSIYNEDWLFFYRLMTQERPRALGRAGTVSQDPYDPFLPSRARSEELGDLVAEGLFAALSAPRRCTPRPTDTEWESLIWDRKQMIASLRHAVTDETTPLAVRASRGQVVAALVDAEQVLNSECGEPGAIRDYLDTWESDCEKWTRHFEQLSRLDGEDPLAFLGVKEDAISRLG